MKQTKTISDISEVGNIVIKANRRKTKTSKPIQKGYKFWKKNYWLFSDLNQLCKKVLTIVYEETKTEMLTSRNIEIEQILQLKRECNHWEKLRDIGVKKISQLQKEHASVILENNKLKKDIEGFKKEIKELKSKIRR